MHALVKSGGIRGIDGYIVSCEADLSGGLPAFDIVGLPGQAVKEARERVRAALKNSGFSFPVSRITVNLAPADIAKEGPVYDLPILTAILAADGLLRKGVPGDYLFAGELSLDGRLRPISGVLPMALAAKDAGITHFFLPKENASEAALAKGPAIIGVEDIKELAALLRGEKPLVPTEIAPREQSEKEAENLPDFAEVKGQQAAKRALEIAAAGGHNVLMAGPPGSGKSMLAKRLPYILPPMTYDEMLEVSKLYSVAGLLKSGDLIETRPFRAPHHTISMAGLVGGGSVPRPGEVSLAHDGVLFLDELPEFSRRTLETLRQPLEDGKLTISRVKETYTYPCRITMVAAMNPCPCGYLGHPTHPCTCSRTAVENYRRKISGPLLDRMDILVTVPAVEAAELESTVPAETSAAIRARVMAAREIQTKRFEKDGISCNAAMERRHVERYCVMTPDAAEMLREGFRALGLSARAHDRILKVSRTIADLRGGDKIEAADIAEALSLRGAEDLLR